MSNDFKRIPYGICDFKQVRRENKYLVDKSMYFERMERAGNFLFLVRPRRFGKSLFLNMLEAYYDINEKDNFQELGSDVENLRTNFSNYLTNCCVSFIKKYASFYPKDLVEDVLHGKNGMDMLNRLNLAAHAAGCPLYLIVDEYDNFTNNVLNVKGQQAYHDLTHGTGFYRDVFKLFKPMFDRIIMLGVAPITLDDLTSGYNIALNMTIDSRFNQMLGFSEDDVRQMIRYYKDAGAIKPTIVLPRTVLVVSPACSTATWCATT